MVVTRPLNWALFATNVKLMMVDLSATEDSNLAVYTSAESTVMKFAGTKDKKSDNIFITDRGHFYMLYTKTIIGFPHESVVSKALGARLAKASKGPGNDYLHKQLAQMYIMYTTPPIHLYPFSVAVSAMKQRHIVHANDIPLNSPGSHVPVAYTP